MPKPNKQDYLLKGIPLTVYNAAKAKAAAHNPPLSIRWVLISLLEKWVKHGAEKMPDPVATDETPIAGEPGKVKGRKVADKAPRASTAKAQQAQKIQTAAAAQKIDLPDLGTSF